MRKPREKVNQGKKKAKASLFVVFLVSLVVLSGITISQEYYVGDIFKLDLRGFGEYTAEIRTPSGEYYQRSNESLFALELGESGNYSVFVKSKSYDTLEEFEVLKRDDQFLESEPIYQEIDNISIDEGKQPRKIIQKERPEIDEERIVIEKDVRWIHKKYITEIKDLKIEVPEEAKNIYIRENGERIDYEERKSFGISISFFKEKENKTLNIDGIQGNLEIEYMTPGPKKEEKILKEGKKEIKISSDFHYENVLSYTDIDESLKIINPKLIKAYWVEEDRFLDVEGFDLNNNSYIDYIEWNIPHLSNQTFIIEIVAAEHLDENKTFISNIYDDVKEKDGNWTLINDSQWVRVTFEIELNSSRDITVYAKSNDSNATIEVYYANSTDKITTFENIDGENYYQVLLTEMNGSDDTFDLKIIGDIEIDHILDPRTLTDTSLTGNETSLYEGEAINITGIYTTPGSGGTDSWTIGLRDANNLINIDSACSNGEIFEIDAVDLSSCGLSGGESCTDNGDGTFALSLKGTINTIIWTLEACINASLNSPVNLTTYKVSGSTTSFNDLTGDIIILAVDYDAPIVNLTEPEDYANFSSGSITFNATLNDTGDGNSNATLYGNWSGGWHANETKGITGSFNWTTFSKTITDGYYTWNYYACDINNNCGFATSNRTLTIDTTPPTVVITTPNPGLNSSDTGLDVNYSVLETHIDECWYNNDTATENISLSNCANITSITWSEGFHNVTVWANDTFGNYNFARTNFTIDSIIPTAVLNDPLDSEIINSSPYVLNASGSSDSGTGIKNAFWYLYNSSDTIWYLIGSDSDPASGWTDSWNILASDGVYDIRVNVSDWTDNIGTDTSNNVVIDLVDDAPTCTVIYPNGEENISNGIILNSSVTETDPSDVVENVSFEYSSNGGSNWNLIGYNTTSDLTYYSFSWDTSPLSDGTNYLIRCNSTDTRNSEGSDTSNSAFTIDNTAPEITGETANDTSLSVNNPVCMNVTVTDNLLEIYTVIAEIDLPTGPNENVTMVDDGTNCDTVSGDSVYSVQYVPLYDGEYNWTKTYANDTAGNMNITFPGINGSASSSSNLIADLISPSVDIEINESGTGTQFQQNCNITCNQSGGNCNDVNISAEYYIGFWTDITTGTTELVNGDDLYSCGDLTSGQSCNYTFTITAGIESGGNDYLIRCHGESFDAAAGFSDNITVHINDKPQPTFTYPSPSEWLHGTETLNGSDSLDSDGTIQNYKFEISNTSTFALPLLLCNGASETCSLNTVTQNPCGPETSECYLRLNVTDNDGVENSTYIQIGIDNVGPTTNLDEPKNDSFINIETKVINATAADSGSGVACLEFDAYYDGGWNSVGVDCSNPYNVTWDLSSIDDQEGIEVRSRANDSEGNFGDYSIHGNITHDITNPAVYNYGPLDFTYSNNQTQIFNFSVEDGISDYLNCSLALNGGFNQTNESVINDTFAQFTVNGLSEDTYNWQVNCTDNAGNQNSSELRTLYIDLSPPTASSQNQTFGGDFTYKVYKYGFANLSVKWNDNYLLNESWLLTNESGSFENKTNYSSPQIMSGTEFNSSFNWSNNSVTPGTVVGWKIYSNDTAGNVGETNEINFTVWGIAEIKSIRMIPSGIRSGENSTINCVVIDNTTDTGVVGYNVTFYNETGIMGYNTTISEGIVEWKTQNMPSEGTYLHGCNITSEPDIYYEVNEKNQSETYLGVGYGISTYTFDSGTEQRAYEGTTNTTTAGIDDSYTDLTTVDPNLQDFEAGQGLYAFTRFEFFVEETLDNITRLNFSWVGSGDVSFGTDGYVIWIYNYTLGDWQQQVSYSTDNTEQVEDFVFSDLSDIDDLINETTGELMLLARTFSAAPTTNQPRTATIYTNFIELEVQYDVLAPEVNLTYPDDSADSFGVQAILNFTASDEIAVDTCELWTNRSGLFQYENETPYTPGINNTFILTGFTQNIDAIRWNVQCNDSSGNIGFTAEDRFFNQIVPPDFTVNNTEIYLYNTSNIVEGVNVTLNATIWNVGGENSLVNVSFYDGDPDLGGTLIANDTIFVEFANTNISKVNWSAKIGPHNIFVRLDPPIATGGLIEEIYEDNNEGNNTFNIPSWQEFYGNASIGVLLGNAGLNELSAWDNGSLVNGNVFIADQEASIEWLNLSAIGRDDTGSPSSNDFSDIDSVIGTSGYQDSVSNRYSIAQTPKATDSFVVSDNLIDNVPIVNSTNNTNFITGILWDNSDDSDSEYDSGEQEDLIFVAKFNEQKQGAYGIYDYEINIPVRLRSYDVVDESNVYLYYELN